MLPIAKPTLDQREVEAAARPILSGWVTQGPEVAAFEAEFAAFVGAPHACAVANGTTALHLALRAVGVTAGDEVITVSHSFIATANSVRMCGATPVFVDIEPSTFNLDPAALPFALTPRTRALLVVHQLGMPCDLGRILDFARAHALPVVEDAACAAGSEILRAGVWERIGRPHGDIACFSFHPRKVITTGDGGMLTTRHPAFDARFRLERQHGMSLSDAARHRAGQVAFESYLTPAFNYRLTDLQAAVGRVQLGRLPELVARRRELAARYTALLRDRAPQIMPPFEPAWARSNWQSFGVRLPPGTDQRAVMQFLLDRGIASRRGVHNAHAELAYQDGGWSCGREPASATCPVGTCARLVESERATRETVLLPIFHDLTEADQERVVDTLADACATAAP
jgi:dTDP-4-amino-4,6-dideoxygalactose transaminase